jgi:hypothetical protein
VLLCIGIGSGLRGRCGSWPDAVPVAKLLLPLAAGTLQRRDEKLVRLTRVNDSVDGIHLSRPVGGGRIERCDPPSSSRLMVAPIAAEISSPCRCYYAGSHTRTPRTWGPYSLPYGVYKRPGGLQRTQLCRDGTWQRRSPLRRDAHPATRNRDLLNGRVDKQAGFDVLQVNVIATAFGVCWCQGTSSHRLAIGCSSRDIVGYSEETSGGQATAWRAWRASRNAGRSSGVDRASARCTMSCHVCRSLVGCPVCRYAQARAASDCK